MSDTKRTIAGTLTARTLSQALSRAEEARQGPEPDSATKTSPLECLPSGCGHYCSNYAVDLVLLADEVKRLKRELDSQRVWTIGGIDEDLATRGR